MSLKVYIGGKLYDKADAKISVYDHGLLYGDGVFEGIRSYSGRVFRLAQHIDRLYDSARSIHLQIPMSKADMAQAVTDTLAVNKLSDAYIRLVVTRGAGSLGLDPRKTDRPAGDHHHRLDQPLSGRALRARAEDRHRRHHAQPSQRTQPADQVAQLSEQHLGQDRGHEFGLPRGPDAQPQGRARRVHRRQHLVVRRGALHTPSLDSGILEGITRDAVIELARLAGHTVVERAMDRHDVYTADECFLTGTAAEVIPVVECDGRPIGAGQPGPITQNLRTRFHALVRGES